MTEQEKIDKLELENTMLSVDLQVYNDRIKNIRKNNIIAQSFIELSEDEKNKRYYIAECLDCGWWGSSRLLLGGSFLEGCDDYDDVYCPICGSTDVENH